MRCLLARIGVSRTIATLGAGGLATAGLVLLAAAGPCAFAAEDNNAAMEQKALLIVPALEDYIAANMKAFDVPGLAIGIVVGDKVVYSRGFGVRSKGGEPVDTHTVFQIGSTSKAFLATTMAIAVDHGKLRWDEQVVDLDPGFQLKDPWVSQEFRVFDLLAQRSGLPPYANDTLVFLGFDAGAMIRSLRFVDPVSTFRSTFAYTNITHLVASRLVASVEGAKAVDGSAAEGNLRPTRDEGQHRHGCGNRSRAQSRRGLSLRSSRLGRGAVHADLPLCPGGRRRHQLERRGHGPLAAPPARQRRV